MARKRRTRRAKKKQIKKSGLGEAWFFGIASLMGLIVFFLKDSLGVQYRWVGVYIWLAALVFGFIFYLFYLLQFVLPLDWRESWFEGLRLALPYNFPMLGALVGLVLGGGRTPAASAKASASLSAGFSEHRSGIIRSNFILALTSGPQFSRAIGPGYVRLGNGETVTQIIDLRRHHRRIPVKAMTRDGIPLEGTVSIVFQVKQVPPPDFPSLPYPYDAGSIFWVDYLDNFRTNHGLLSWNEHIAPQAASTLIAELSRFTLDQLFAQSNSGRSLMGEFMLEIQDRLTDEYDRFGIVILRVSIGQFKLADDIMEQRLQNWQNEWEGRAKIRPKTPDLFTSERSRLAEARAQIQLIRSVIESIETMHRSSDTELSEVVNSRFIDAVENSMAKDEVKKLLSDQERQGTLSLRSYP
jgi:hypothetical protein